MKRSESNFNRINRNSEEVPNPERRKFLKLFGAGLVGATSSLLSPNFKVRAEPSSSSESSPELAVDINFEFQRLKSVRRLSEIFSTPLEKIRNEIRFLHNRGFVFDFTSLPEVKKLNKLPSLSRRCLEIVKLLSVKTKEEILFENEKFNFYTKPETLNRMIIIFYHNSLYLSGKISYSQFLESISSLKTSFQDLLALPVDDIGQNKSKIGSVMGNFEGKLYEDIFQIDEKYDSANLPRVESWGNQDSCNLYALEIVKCLGLQYVLSQRVDGEDSPVVYKNKGRQVQQLVYKNGKLVRPVGKIRELSAKGIHEWLGRNGEKNGWEDVTTYSYRDKINLLRQGYIFYGATTEHNWIVFGQLLDGILEPVLTQASTHELLKLFSSESSLGGSAPEILKIIQSLAPDDILVPASDYKLTGFYEEDTQNTLDPKIYAIKVDDFRRFF